MRFESSPVWRAQRFSVRGLGSSGSRPRAYRNIRSNEKNSFVAIDGKSRGTTKSCGW